MNAGPRGATCPTASALALLRSGVPLSLLFDLVCGPNSEDLMARERPVQAAGAQQT